MRQSTIRCLANLKLLEQKGFAKDSLLVAPLCRQPRDSLAEFKTVHRDGKTPYDLAFIFAMIFMLLGAIYGFVLTWGPIIWAIIGIFIGAFFGLALDALIGKKPFQKPESAGSEVVLIIQCHREQTDTVESILWSHQALGISKVPNNSNESDSIKG
jgi:hypothetical protein